MADNEGEAIHVDSILLALGPLGRYQILQFILCILAYYPSYGQLFNQVFISKANPHKCAKPQYDNETDLLELLKIDKPADYVNVTFGTCEISVTTGDRTLSPQPCLFGMDYEFPRDTSAQSSFDLVCDQAPLNKLPQTVLIAGQGIGAVLTTIVSDRYGRKVALVGSNFMMLVLGTALAFVPNYTGFIVLKFFIGLFQQGCVTGMVTFNLELFPTYRRRITALFNVPALLFVSWFLPVVGYTMESHSWRYLQLIITATSLLAILQLCFMDESIRWLLANGKKEKAIKCIKRAAKVNNRNLTQLIQGLQETRGECLVDESEKSSQEKSSQIEMTEVGRKKAERQLNFWDIFRIRRLLVNALSLWFAWFTTALGTFALFLSSSQLAGSPYLNFYLLSIVGLTGEIFRYFMLDRLGRKLTTIIFFGILGLCTLASGIFVMYKGVEVFDNLLTTSYMLGMIGASGSFELVFFYTPEMFPTNIRNQALGVSSFMGRVGGMLAPFTGDLADLATWAPGTLIGCCAIIVAFLLQILPETKGKELPQTLEELEQWYTNRKNNTQTEDTNKIV